MQVQPRIAISGASGFVGSRLVATLRARDCDVVRLVRKSKKLLADELAWVPDRGLEEPERLNGFDGVIHLAGRTIAGRWTPREQNLIRESRVTATKRLVAQLLALEQRPPVFVGASAIGFYGNCGDRFIDELQPVGADFLSAVVRDWEAAAKPLEAAGVRVAHARFGIVLDPSGGALAKMLPLFRRGIGGRLGSGRQYWSWIALSDVIEGLYWLMRESRASGAYNFVAPRAVTNGSFTARLANAVGRPAVLPAPAFALRWILGAMANEVLLSSCRAIPKRLEAEGFKIQHTDLSEYFAQCLPC